MIACRSPPVLGDAGAIDASGDVEEAIDTEEPIDARTFPDAEPIIDASQPIEQYLEIEFLGVGSFAIASGGDRVLTPPFYSNPSLPDVLTGTVRADPTAIDRFLDPIAIEGAQAILVGHAHYDHLMDVPHVFTRTPQATIYGNLDMQRLLAAFAPDRAPQCS